MRTFRESKRNLATAGECILALLGTKEPTAKEWAGAMLIAETIYVIRAFAGVKD